MSEPTLKQLQERAAFRDRANELRAALADPNLPGWEADGLRQMLNEHYVAGGFREDVIFNGSVMVRKENPLSAMAAMLRKPKE